jgi:hypothetical protein
MQSQSQQAQIPSQSQPQSQLHQSSSQSKGEGKKKKASPQSRLSRFLWMPFSSTHVKLQLLPKSILMASCCAEEMLIANCKTTSFFGPCSFRHSRLCNFNGVEGGLDGGRTYFLMMMLFCVLCWRDHVQWPRRAFLYMYVTLLAALPFEPFAPLHYYCVDARRPNPTSPTYM